MKRIIKASSALLEGIEVKELIDFLVTINNPKAEKWVKLLEGYGALSERNNYGNTNVRI